MRTRRKQQIALTTMLIVMAMFVTIVIIVLLTAPDWARGAFTGEPTATWTAAPAVAEQDMMDDVQTALAETPTWTPAPATDVARETLIAKWVPTHITATLSSEMISFFETAEAGDMLPSMAYEQTTTAMAAQAAQAATETATHHPTPVAIPVRTEDIPSLDPGLQTMIAGGPPPTPNATATAMREQIGHAQYQTSGDIYIQLVTAFPVDEEIRKTLNQYNDSNNEYYCGTDRYKGIQLTQNILGGYFWTYAGGDKIGTYTIPDFDPNEIPKGGIFIPDGNYIIPDDSVFVSCFERSSTNG